MFATITCLRTSKREGDRVASSPTGVSRWCETSEEKQQLSHIVRTLLSITLVYPHHSACTQVIPTQTPACIPRGTVDKPPRIPRHIRRRTFSHSTRTAAPAATSGWTVSNTQPWNSGIALRQGGLLGVGERERATLVVTSARPLCSRRRWQSSMHLQQ